MSNDNQSAYERVGIVALTETELGFLLGMLMMARETLPGNVLIAAIVVPLYTKLLETISTFEPNFEAILAKLKEVFNGI